MYIPEWFEETLRRDFRGRYLIRWSEAKQCFVLHERVARPPAIKPRRLHEKLQKLPEHERDEYEFRLRTGTSTFVDIVPSARYPCPKCDAKVYITKNSWSFAHCGACGKDFKAVSYELGHLLLEQLRYLDLERGGLERQAEELEKSELEKKRVDARDHHNYVEAMVKEDANQIFGIPLVGRTAADQRPDGTPTNILQQGASA